MNGQKQRKKHYYQGKTKAKGDKSTRTRGSWGYIRFEVEAWLRKNYPGIEILTLSHLPNVCCGE
jgi:hypothetical protein